MKDERFCISFWVHKPTKIKTQAKRFCIIANFGLDCDCTEVNGRLSRGNIKCSKTKKQHNFYKTV